MHQETKATSDVRPAAVYRPWAADGTLLYVGSSYNPDARYQIHRSKEWGQEIARRAMEWLGTRAGAYRAELEAIGTESPKHNVYGTGRDSEALRRLSAANRSRGQVQAEAYRLQREVRQELQAEGADWREVHRMSKAAFVDYLDASGLFEQWVTRLRARQRTV
ncbi:hypothetical protein ABZ923_38740 [Streptomyces sp. NPDC046881]|uniref:hypothetical protein n=1 Tax=Streptomyces sp. NPDC046881 TaxID=3155374 RepID=UPI0033F04A37